MIRCKLFLLLSIGFVSIFAQDTIRGTYSYTYGDSESLVEARQTCKDLALRDGIESYYIFVESSTEVENYQLKEDIIETLSAGYIKNLQVVEQTEEGRTITTSIQAEVDPEEVKSLVEEIVKERTPSDQNSEVNQDDQFNAVFSEYQRRLKSAESLHNSQEYDGSVTAYQESEKFLERFKPDQNRPFQWNVYQAAKFRSTVQTDLARIERLEKLRRVNRAKEITKTMVQDAVQLKNYLVTLEKLEGLSQQQEMIRKSVSSHCRSTLARAKQKAKQYFNKNQ